MAYTTIDKPSDYFETVLYTGNGSTQSITSLDFQPDWVWLKQRNTTRSHWLFDSVRGATERLHSDDTSAEATDTSTLTSFNSNGFSLGSSVGINQSSGTYASWNWKAGGTASSNTDGSITSSVSANQDAGFSIVSYTGNATAGATIGHGLGSVVKFAIFKRRNSSGNWQVYHHSIGNDHVLKLNGTDAKLDDNTFLNDTSPSSSLITLGAGGLVNGNGDTHICYAFAEKQGFSKFGSYTGNGNADGTFVYTGQKSAFVMIKRTDSATGGYWVMFDNKRNTFNVMDKYLFAQASDAEDTSNLIDFYSNGFRPIVSNLMHNGSGASYIYMAFAENPFVTSTGVPACAR
jgi:hypothetical protein